MEMYHPLILADLAEEHRRQLMAEADEYRRMSQVHHRSRHRRRRSAPDILAGSVRATWSALRDLTKPDLNDPALPRVRDYPIRPVPSGRDNVRTLTVSEFDPNRNNQNNRDNRDRRRAA
jgi:hypothetical protein